MVNLAPLAGQTHTGGVPPPTRTRSVRSPPWGTWCALGSLGIPGRWGREGTGRGLGVVGLGGVFGGRARAGRSPKTSHSYQPRPTGARRGCRAARVGRGAAAGREALVGLTVGGCGSRAQRAGGTRRGDSLPRDETRHPMHGRRAKPARRRPRGPSERGAERGHPSRKGSRGNRVSPGVPGTTRVPEPGHGAGPRGEPRGTRHAAARNGARRERETGSVHRCGHGSRAEPWHARACGSGRWREPPKRGALLRAPRSLPGRPPPLPLSPPASLLSYSRSYAAVGTRRGPGRTGAPGQPSSAPPWKDTHEKPGPPDGEPGCGLGRRGLDAAEDHCELARPHGPVT